MTRSSIRANYERPLEFERGRIIGLKESGSANWRIARHTVAITATHCQSRLRRFLARSGWNHADWERIAFREEFHFQPYTEDHRRRVWRRPVPWPYFSEDKARPHVARVAINCLTACQTLPWQPRSTDLSSIEHVWDMMGRRQHPPGNVDDLA
ncbi:transposable element Tc1 transposase [Trichonephila clavipes]|uniref:Transposable element Tc1 transposase n=1 Tax=Trichonephila clavipes TaxID=2585209 RepID=A0A8X6VCZ1_TRICX|nr:transposable element Tc1 transposase [Trichonephila clavipes]